TPESARGLLDTLRGGQVTPLDSDDLTHAVSEPGALDRMARGGEGLLGKIFGGGDIGGITGALASTLGVGKAGIGKFMPLIGSIVMGYLSKLVIGKGMDAGGLLGFLKDTGKSAAAMLPAPLARLVGGGSSPIESRPVVADVGPHMYEEPREERRSTMGWLPWVLAGPAAACLATLLPARRKPDVAAPKVTTPAAEVQKVSGRMPTFSEYLTGDLSMPWIASGLEFQKDSDQVLP